MAFAPCTDYWGSAVLFPREPDILEFKGVVYRPFSKQQYFTEYPDWGVTDIDGRLIMAAAYTRGPHDELVGQAIERTPLSRTALNHAPDATYIYGGQLIPHYGHFLLSSLSRFWPVDRPGLSHLKILVHSDYTVEEMMRISYIGALLKATGINTDRMVTFPNDTFIENLIVPLPSFVEQKQAHAGFRETSLAIGRALMGKHQLKAGSRPIYISKTRLTGGVARFTNEEVVEDVLRRHGVEIVYPETLSLQDQVRLFATHDVIAGSATSAFHSHILVENRPSILSINSKNALNTNFLLLDGLKDMRASYLYEQNCREVKDGNFMLSYELSDPVSYATSILDWMDSLPTSEGSSCYPIPRGKYPSPNILPDLAGPSFESVIREIHRERAPETYLEIGDFPETIHGMANCPALIVGPHASASTSEYRTALFKEPSAEFFAKGPHAASILGGNVALALLNGHHHAEQLIADFIAVEGLSKKDGLIILHDCVPLELAMTDSGAEVPLGLPHRGGWWIGDLWRVPLILKVLRPDLKIRVIPAQPAGLIMITGLDPESRVLSDRKMDVDRLMHSYDLKEMTIAGFHIEMGL